MRIIAAHEAGVADEAGVTDDFKAVDELVADAGRAAGDTTLLALDWVAHLGLGHLERGRGGALDKNGSEVLNHQQYA